MYFKDNKKIFDIHFQYQKTLEIIISKVLMNYKGIPIEWEDIYYPFLFKVQQIVEKYDKTLGVPFKTFLGQKCKFFALNYCREFLTHKHKIMNNYISNSKIKFSCLQDFDIDKPKIDLAFFSKDELQIFQKYFLEEKTMKTILNETNISNYKIRYLIKKIKTKIYIQHSLN